MFAQLFVAAVLAVSAQSVVAASCSRSYTVQEGDYCDKISQAQNVSTFQLAVVNQNSVDASCSNLVVGQTICLAENSAEDCTTTYAVRIGDTCSDIASRAGLNTTILYLNNPQIDEECSNIYTGEVLCIAPTVQAPPVPAGGVTVTASSTTIFVSQTATPSANVAAAVTPTPDISSTPAASTTPAPSSSSGANAADDENLPYCDEL